jgi:hypothetical protein
MERDLELSSLNCFSVVKDELRTANIQNEKPDMEKQTIGRKLPGKVDVK